MGELTNIPVDECGTSNPLQHINWTWLMILIGQKKKKKERNKTKTILNYEVIKT